MLARTIVLTAIIASCVSSLVAFTIGLLVAVALFHVPPVEAQGSATPITLTPSATVMPQTTMTPTAVPVVRAERFELVDGSGRVQAVLGEQAGLRGLVVRGDSEAWRVALGMVQGDQPYVVISDEAGMSRLVLSMLQNVAVELHDPAGRPIAALVGQEDGGSFLTLDDPTGARATARLEVTTDGPALLGLAEVDSGGILLGTGQGLTALGLMDATGQHECRIPATSGLS